MSAGTTTRARLAAHYLHERADASRLGSVVSLTAHSLAFPMAQLNIHDNTAQHTLSQVGIDGPTPALTPLRDSMCQFTIDRGDVLAVDDLSVHERYAALPGVANGFARSYLGVPLAGRESRPVGTLCVIDSQPRRITDRQIDLIRELGEIAEVQLDQLRSAAEMSQAAHGEVAALAEAIDAGEIVPWYQPVVELGTERVVAYEALARWQRASGEVVDPGDFVAIAENSDLVIDLDRTVLRQAMVHLRQWRHERPGLRMNVNLSTLHLEIPSGADAVHAIIADAGLDSDAVTLEITESRQLADARAAQDAVTTLRRHGYRVTLDDFGSGWSSLEWVLTLPITGIKVDRAVTERLGDPAGDAIHRAIRSLTDEIALETTVEGIATSSQYAAAKWLGYDYGQGYRWSPPLPAPEAAQLVGLWLD